MARRKTEELLNLLEKINKNQIGFSIKKRNNIPFLEGEVIEKIRGLFKYLKTKYLYKYPELLDYIFPQVIKDRISLKTKYGVILIK